MAVLRRFVCWRVSTLMYMSCSSLALSTGAACNEQNRDRPSYGGWMHTFACWRLVVELVALAVDRYVHLCRGQCMPRINASHLARSAAALLRAGRPVRRTRRPRASYPSSDTCLRDVRLRNRSNTRAGSDSTDSGLQRHRCIVCCHCIDVD